MNPGTFQGAGLGFIPNRPSGGASEQIILSSTTWTAPYSTRYAIFAVGAGGSGANANATVAGGARQCMAVSGGGAGGLAVRSVYLQAGTKLNITIGAGGAGVAGSDNGTVGNSGGATTVFGNQVNLVALGGSGGTVQVAAQSASVTGAAGGVASGGDFNITGGSGGNATATCSSATTMQAEAVTGGGAVGWYGTGYSGGAATATSSTTSNSLSFATTGGAGVGGAGGACTITSTAGTTISGNSAGGSSAQVGNASTNGNAAETPGYNFTRVTQTTAVSVFIMGGNGAAGAAGGDVIQGMGGATGGSHNRSAGMCAGSGARPQSVNALAGLGGGSGALSGTSTAGSGGNGFVVIAWGPPI